MGSISANAQKWYILSPKKFVMKWVLSEYQWLSISFFVGEGGPIYLLIIDLKTEVLWVQFWGLSLGENQEPGVPLQVRGLRHRCF